MWRIIRFIFTGSWEVHEHEWEIIETSEILNKHGIVGKSYILQCTECGDITNRNIRL